MDFLEIKERTIKSSASIIIRPVFKVYDTKDLLVRGKSFYAIWNEETGLWSTDSYDAVTMIDNELEKYVKDRGYNNQHLYSIEVKTMEDFSSTMWTEFQKYMNSRPNSKHILDNKITFANTPVKKSDYVSKRLNYSMEEGPIEAYNELMNVLYEPEERRKLEWAIGAIISGDAKNIQKFIVLYGEAGTGKSTVLNIIQKLFDGYYSVFEAKALTSNSNAFATEQFRDNPLVMIQHDGDLSRIEDNSKLNSIISHEEIPVNEKFKSSYTIRPNSFLFMGTNKPVKITDAKSGLIRRLIDVKPTGEKVSPRKYQTLMSKIDLELGAIANHCLNTYTSMGKSYYSNYVPRNMMEQTDYFYNFVEDSFFVLKERNNISLKIAYEMYKTYCSDSNEQFVLNKMKFREELKNYYDDFKDISRDSEGNVVRSYYLGFKTDKFEYKEPPSLEESEKPYTLEFDDTKSILDDLYSNCPAQYAKSNDTPDRSWDSVTTTLKDIDTHKTHYVKVPNPNHIVADFDLKDEQGNKSYELNVAAASKWPKTYAELSKSGAGIHLHYIYDGDVSKLSRVYDEGIEIKVYNGNSSLRRKLTKCSNSPIAHINSDFLPLKGEDKVVNFTSVKNEKAIRTLIKENLNKKYHAGTKPSIDFIDKILKDAYNSGVHYDISDMKPAILYFAAGSTHQAGYCIKLVKDMKFKSEEPSLAILNDNKKIVFFDVEVFPNLFVFVYKFDGDNVCTVLINPTPEQIEPLLSFNLIGFNCRRYDNHIVYARLLGYTNEQLYNLSKRIIAGSSNAFFSEAYNLSYTDIYDFASAANKQSLKKFEIQLGLHHQECPYDWDKPVPEDKWHEVGDYCCNDVNSTEATFHFLSADWDARQILAKLSGLSVNDTTNAHTTKFIFGDDKNPQEQFVYTDLSVMFPGYKYDNGVSTYRGEETGEGGYVYAEPGMYTDVALLDVESMHPTSIENLNLFGDKYTARFGDIKKSRLLIKHQKYDEAKKILDGALEEFLDDQSKAKSLSNALKTVINSVYGLTSAKFDNKFRDPRNIDNIVAKRGALFMINLKHEVQERGFTVAHIKTDSIKIPNATPEIIEFVMNYGKLYGYNFEHEATYSKMCLVNDAVYIAQYKDGENAGKWTATGTQFAVPYVFKTLFSHEPIKFEDMCETKSVSTSLYLDFNETDPEEHNYRFVGKVGAFCPIKSGCGGGLLLRKKDENYSFATGCKDYRWMESEVVRNLDNKEDIIDKNYYRKLVDKAVEEISKYGDFEWFISDNLSKPNDNDMPYDKSMPFN